MTGSQGGSDGSGAGSNRGAVPDAALAAVALVGTLAVGWWLEARPLAVPALAGGVATLALEAALGRHHDRVRAAWERPGTRVGTLLVGSVAGLATASLAPSPVASAVAAGLATYLALLVGVRIGVVSPPRSW